MKNELALKLTKWLACPFYCGFNLGSSLWKKSTWRCIDGDVKELLNEYSEEDETSCNEDIEESVDNGTDADGGKISKDAAFRHDDDSSKCLRSTGSR